VVGNGVEIYGMSGVSNPSGQRILSGQRGRRVFRGLKSFIFTKVAGQNNVCSVPHVTSKEA